MTHSSQKSFQRVNVLGCYRKSLTCECHSRNHTRRFFHSGSVRCLSCFQSHRCAMRFESISGSMRCRSCVQSHFPLKTLLKRSFLPIFPLRQHLKSAAWCSYLNQSAHAEGLLREMDAKSHENEKHVTFGVNRGV